MVKLRQRDIPIEGSWANRSKGVSIMANYVGKKFPITKEVRKIWIAREDILGFLITLEDGRHYAYGTFEELKADWASVVL